MTMNEWICEHINNGVYQCGFATSQQAYDVASQKVRLGLNKCEAILLKTNGFLLGPNLTEADLRLLPTMLTL
jgi:glutathionyl-hydroquinone reductase